MNGETIKSFMVGLGFSVDSSSLAQFNKALASATLKVAALYGSIKIMSAAIVFSLSKISEGFEQMGYEYKILAPAINKALTLRREMFKAYSAAGVNIVKVVQSSARLNLSLAKTKIAFEAIYRSTASRFFDVLTKQSDLFRQKIYANMPRIQNVLEHLIRFIFKMLEATTALGLRLWSILTRVYEFFVMLDKATEGWSTVILGVIAAWKLLNLSFLATPLGLLLTGFAALLVLWDDFKTFQEGGESLFNWSSFIPVIDAVGNSLKSLWGILTGVFGAVMGVYTALWKLLSSDFSGALSSWSEAGYALISVFRNLWDLLKNTVGLIGSLAGWAGHFFQNSNVAANLQNTPGGAPRAAPVGNGIQNSQTNQNVTQQTQISVTGVADASGAGKAVGDAMSRQNFDLVRNFKPVSR